MTTYYEAGEALRAIKIVVSAERITIEPQRVKITSAHTGQRAKARGEAYAYIDIPLQSVPKRVR